MLVSCVAYRDGKKVADLRPDEISDWVEQPDCLVWVALKDAEPAELAAMQEEFGLHELAVEDARHGHQRPKIEEYGDSLFVVLRTVAPAADGGLEQGEVDIFVGPNYVLSVRNRTREGFAAVRARCEREPHLLRLGPAFVLYALMDTVVDRYFPLIQSIEDELDEVETRVFAGRPARQNVQALYGLKQRLVTIQHAVRPLLEATARLYGGRVPRLCAGLEDYFRDVSDHLLRLTQALDSLRDMVTTAMSVQLALSSAQENETTKRLAAYAALIAVPTLIAGLYGMNFEHMPELKWAFGYPAALLFMLAVDLWLFWRFRRAGWL
jgi:magnesium transporter